LVALGILFNISASEKGLSHIAQSISRNGFEVIPKLSEICHSYSEGRVRQLSLLLLHNVLRNPDLSFQLIRENCFQWLCDFGHEFTEQREKALFLAILDRLLNEQYEKTIKYCCKDSLERLSAEFVDADFIGINLRIAKLMGRQEAMPPPRQTSRFGFPRVYH
jgi:hypothetical protein